MIEDVKKFTTELQVEAFRDPGVFKQSKIKVVDTRPMEVPATCITLRAQSGGPERGRIEVLATRLSWVFDDNRCNLIGSVHGQCNRTAERGP
jgi:hypothetical protein